VPLDAQPLGVLTMRLLELLEAQYGEQAADVEIRAAMVLVDVQVPDPEEPEESWTHVRWQFGSVSDDWNPKRSSSAYAAGLVAEAYSGLTDGEPEPEL
jgi:hypothetical protein